MDPEHLERAYREFSSNMGRWVPDGVIEVGLENLSEMGLLNRYDLDEEDPDEVTESFQVIEQQGRITLYNETFAIWIEPKLVKNEPVTFTYISQIDRDEPNLELVFSTRGVYNTPKFILKVLQRFLIDVIDTDALIASISRPASEG